MSRYRVLKGGAPRLLDTHGGDDGRIYRRAWGALVRELGQPERGSLLALEMGRCAVAWVTYVAATKALTAARRTREQGHGRRPSARLLEQLSKRQGLADVTYGTQLLRVRQLATEHAERHKPTPAEIIAEIDAAAAAAREPEPVEPDDAGA